MRQSRAELHGLESLAAKARTGRANMPLLVPGSGLSRYPAATAEAWIDGDVHAFAFFGGVPRLVLYNKDRCLVSRILPGGTRKRVRLFSGFIPKPLGWMLARLLVTRCPVMAMSSRVRRPGPPAPWRSGPVPCAILRSQTAALGEPRFLVRIATAASAYT